MERFVPTQTSRRRFLLGAATSASVAVAGFGSARGDNPRTSSPEANKAVVRRVIEEIQRDGDFTNFEALFTQDYVDHTAFPGFRRDREGTRIIYQTLRAAFPGFAATIHRQIAEGDLVTSHKTYRGTHRGEFNGVAPTGRPISFEAIDIMRVRDGQITDHWGVTDIGALMAQLRPGN